MPYKSLKQMKFFNANRKRLEAQGVDVDEWNASTKGKKLPEQVKKSQDYSLPSDIKPAGSYESLKKTMSENMARHDSMAGNTQPAPGQLSVTPPPAPQSVDKLFQVDSNVPKVTPTLPIDPMVATQSKMASVLAYLLYANKLK